MIPTNIGASPIATTEATATPVRSNPSANKGKNPPDPNPAISIGFISALEYLVLTFEKAMISQSISEPAADLKAEY
jgi:hypothetical protein